MTPSCRESREEENGINSVLRGEPEFLLRSFRDIGRVACSYRTLGTEFIPFYSAATRSCLSFSRARVRVGPMEFSGTPTSELISR